MATRAHLTALLLLGLFAGGAIAQGVHVMTVGWLPCVVPHGISSYRWHLSRFHQVAPDNVVVLPPLVQARLEHPSTKARLVSTVAL